MRRGANVLHTLHHSNQVSAAQYSQFLTSLGLTWNLRRYTSAHAQAATVEEASMKRRMMVGLFAGSLLLLLLQGNRSVSAQQQTPQKDYSQSLQWETVENIKVLRVWKSTRTSDMKEYPQIALAQVSDSDFQKFVQNPDLLRTFVNAHNVFPDHINTAGPWASLMTTNDHVDPPGWLLTFSHSKASNMSITSQPLVPES
jgi:hypothetical protein